ncbi:MAG: glycerophosphodiester phosphodiesterase [Candidatus Hodarchaeales archaeon]|jgi:glycerophosphoryl diester phosphodiesterase
MTYPLIIAHRGASGVAPENTILAFWTAIASNADLIEFDVQVTSDQQVVVFHDRSLERITGDLGGIADYPLIDLIKKDVGKWKDDAFTGTRIPTFEQILKEIPDEKSLIVEIKPQNKEVEKDRFLERKVLELLDDYRKKGIGKDGYISVRDTETWEWFQDNTSKFPCGLMSKKRTPDEFLEIVTRYGIPISQIRWKNFSNEDLQSLKSANSKIMAFYADTLLEWDKLIEYEVDGILTNFPSLLQGYLFKKK